MSENPTSIAIPTNLPVFSQYYVNAGNRHVILFDIDEQDKIIEFNAIFHTSRLYRLLNENKEAPE